MMPPRRPPKTARRAFNLLHFEFINVAEAESRITGLGVDMLQLHFFPLAVRIAALTVAIGPLLATSADARGPGGGGGGFHMGGGGGFHAGGGFGGFGRPMMHSAPIVRSFSGVHSVPRFTSPGPTNGHVTAQHLATQHLATT